jgi:hypothetical protein
MADLKLSSSIQEIWAEKLLRKNRYGISFMGNGVELALKEMGRESGPLRRRILELLVRNCEVASLVGASFSTAPNRIHGPVREMPYERLYSGDLSLTFREVRSTKVRKFFTSWQNSIYKNTSGNFTYYDDYIGDIEIYQYDEKGDSNAVYGIRIKEAYPKNIHEMTLGYAENDSYHRQTVDFAFRDWEEISIPRKPKNQEKDNTSFAPAPLTFDSPPLTF